MNENAITWTIRLNGQEYTGSIGLHKELMPDIFISKATELIAAQMKKTIQASQSKVAV